MALDHLLVADVTNWHETQFPNATLLRVGFKFAEEAGELERAIGRLWDAQQAGDLEASQQWLRQAQDELGDVLVVSTALARRFLFCTPNGALFTRFYDDVASREYRR